MGLGTFYFDLTVSRRAARAIYLVGFLKGDFDEGFPEVVRGDCELGFYSDSFWLWGCLGDQEPMCVRARSHRGKKSAIANGSVAVAWVFCCRCAYAPSFVLRTRRLGSEFKWKRFRH